jgi:hypothetical protein
MKRFRLVNMIAKSTLGVTNSGTAFSFYAKFLPQLINTKQIVLLAAILCSLVSNAQLNNTVVADTAYQKVLAERSAKIVHTLNIKDEVLLKKVQQYLIDQYLQLNAIHDGSKTATAAIKAKQLAKEETDAAIKKETERKTAALKQLHDVFIAHLNTALTTDQIEKVKDGMTYSVLPVTWTAYMDMLPRLTQEQKDKMYAWLVEARELAMDEGSSDAKHAVFGKYKGRINNYLSAAGYDMKKEGEEWAKRIQAAKEAKQVQN